MAYLPSFLLSNQPYNLLKGKYFFCRQIKAHHTKLPEVSYNLRGNIKDRDKITTIPFLFNQGTASSIQLISSLYGLYVSSNNYNAAYQPVLNRISDTKYTIHWESCFIIESHKSDGSHNYTRFIIWEMRVLIYPLFSL